MKTSGCTIGYQIGFGGQFYTLWYVGPADSYGIQQADYCGRISKDKSVAMSKYPNYPFTGLKGDEWNWVTRGKEKKDTTPNCEKTEFWFGKYYGTSILDCSDVEYLKWCWGYLWDSLSDKPVNHSLRSALIARGCVFLGNRMFESQEDLNLWKEKDEALSLIFNGTFEVEFSSNVNGWSNEVRFYTGIEVIDEEYEYGYSLKISDKIELTFHNSGKYQWYTLGDVRSMKKKRARITTVDQEIIECIYL